MTVVPVILCGGSGTRLWPLSRRNFAKHHIGIIDGESPYQRTLRRLAASRTFGKPIVIAGQEGRFLASDQAEAVGVDDRARARADGPRHPAGGDARSPPRGAARSDGGGLRPPVRPPHPRSLRLRRCGGGGGGGGRGRRLRRARPRADPAGLGLRLHPAGRDPRHRRAAGRRLRREARRPAGGGADRRGLPVERRHVLLPRRRRARRDRPARAGDPRRGRGGARRGRRGSRRAPARQELRQGREGELRLCGDGADEAGGGGAGRLRLVRHRRLARGLGAVAQGRERRRGRGTDGADRRRIRATSAPTSG